MSGAFLRVDDYYPIVPFLYCVALTGWDTWCFIAVLAYIVHICHLNLGHSAPDYIGDLHPELSGVGLGPGIRWPVVSHVFILAGKLTVVTSIALCDVDN
jgi:hypothetical protein